MPSSDDIHPPAATDPPGPVPLEPQGLSGHGVIAGFGLPGRAVAEALSAAQIPYCVIELNTQTVFRLLQSPRKGVFAVVGDVCDPQTLRRAGIERAALFAVTVPIDAAALEAVRVARQLNPALHIMVRCRHVSTAIEATRRGADEVVSEEQVVAQEFTRLVASRSPPARV